MGRASTSIGIRRVGHSGRRPSVLTEAQVDRAIVLAKDHDMTQEAIARRFGVSTSTVQQALKRRKERAQ